jgi:hypothetical protein
MRRLLLALAALPFLVPQPADAKVKHKSKEKTSKQKSFEPMAVEDVRLLAGRYEGIEGLFWAELSVDPNGQLEVTLYENGARVPLRGLQLVGARLEATKVGPSGDEERFEATVGERVVNGDRRFGLLVEGDVRIDDDTVFNRLFYRRAGDSR